MSKFIQILAIFIVGLSIASCSVEVEEYQTVETPFDIQKYFHGHVIAWGIVQDYTDKVQRRFCVEINGTWQDDEGILAETFYFNDGEVSYRNWQFSKQMDGTYKATAEDVNGTALGKHQGFAFQFQYELALNVDDDVYNVTMDDWMYQLDEYRVINKTSMSKLGINVADITIFFDKEMPLKTCPSIDGIK